MAFYKTVSSFGPMLMTSNNALIVTDQPQNDFFPLPSENARLIVHGDIICTGKIIMVDGSKVTEPTPAPKPVVVMLKSERKFDL